MPNLISLIIYTSVMLFTPGPNNIIAMSNGTRFGFKKSLSFCFSVVSGFFVILILSSFFSILLGDIINSVEKIITLIGFVFIMYLAFKIFKSPPPDDTNDAKLITFKTGFFMQFVNSKGIISGIVIATSYITPYFNEPLPIILICIMLSSVGFLSITSWTLFGTLFNKFLAKYYKITNIIMSLLLVYCAISLLIH